METTKICAIEINFLGIREAAEQSVRLIGGIHCVKKEVHYTRAGSVKAALSHPTHQRVTQTVSRLIDNLTKVCIDSVWPAESI